MKQNKTNRQTKKVKEKFCYLNIEDMKVFQNMKEISDYEDNRLKQTNKQANKIILSCLDINRKKGFFFFFYNNIYYCNDNHKKEGIE